MTISLNEANKKGLTCMKSRTTTNQKYTTDSQKPKRREHKHKIKGNKTRKKKENGTKNQLENKV